MKGRPSNQLGNDALRPAGQRRIARAFAPAAFLLLLVAGCDFDGVTETQRPPVEAVNLTLTVRADSLAEAAALLGWGDVIPDVEVTIQRTGLPTDPPPMTVRTGADGTARLEGIDVGVYRVSLSRPLSLEEFERVRETGVTGIADGFSITVSGPTAEVELVPAPALRGGLIISEYHFMPFFRSGVGTYATGGFLELYNNSDSTIYLDRKLVGRAFDGGAWATANIECDETTRFRTDPAGLWVWEIQQFPGSGLDYPLEPGATAVIATDAIDHSEFVDELLDLSGADFEFSGPTGPDNPAVPNMIDVGPRSSPTGHGIIFQSFFGIPFVADPTDVDSLPRDRLHWSAHDIVRIPRNNVISVAAFYTTYPEITTWCDPFVHADFDRRAGQLLPHGEGMWLASVNRNVTIVLPDGRRILQDTRTSETDFYLGQRTPGSIP